MLDFCHDLVWLTAMQAVNGQSMCPVSWTVIAMYVRTFVSLLTFMWQLTIDKNLHHCDSLMVKAIIPLNKHVCWLLLVTTVCFLFVIVFPCQQPSWCHHDGKQDTIIIMLKILCIFNAHHLRASFLCLLSQVCGWVQVLWFWASILVYCYCWHWCCIVVIDYCCCLNIRPSMFIARCPTSTPM